jgi:hypothetical protein
VNRHGDAPLHHALALVRLMLWLVPAGRRGQWRRQWEADLHAQWIFLQSSDQGGRRARRDLWLRAAGLVPHALSLRLRSWNMAQWLSGFRQDLRVAVRGLMRQPVFSAVAVLTLTVGIGANTALFAVVNGVLLQPLPYPAAAELAVVNVAPNEQDQLPGSMSYPDLADLRDL